MIESKITGDTLKFLFDNAPPSPKVLEIGTLRWYANPTHHKQWFPQASEYVMTDISAGTDVDIVSDAHTLSETFSDFDIVIACSVWEHLHSPWIAAQELLKVLKPGGLFFVQSHLVFPEHGYPHDYFRFTTKAFEHIFKGASVVITEYQYPCKIVPPPGVEWHDGSAPEFLNTCIAGLK